MFETEAEERTKQYMNEYEEKYNCENTKLETDNYNAGLEQGYEDGFQDGAEFGYNKANELNYLKDGTLPKENQEVLIYFTLPDKSRTAVAISRFENNDFDVADLQDVIAWKEFLPPEKLRYGEK